MGTLSREGVASLNAASAPNLPQLDWSKLLPNFVWVIEVPERAADLARRYHNQYAKEALRETIEQWHDSPKGFPKHFKRDARQRYRHFKRDEKYKRMKARKYHSTVDLIKTGRTQRRMESQYKLRLGGSATGGNLSVNLILSFPFKGGSGRFRTNLDRGHRQMQAEQNWKWIEQMKIELQRFDDEDPKILARWFKANYMKRVEQHRAARKRKRIPTR